MKAILFDTSTAVTTVCAVSGDRVFESKLPEIDAYSQKPAHSQELLPLIVELSNEAGLDLVDIEEVIVGVGPGTYTGVRIGVATARAIAQVAGVPLKPVSSLKALALSATEAAGEETGLLPVIDAKRGEVFSALYGTEEGSLKQYSDQVASSAEELPQRLDLDPAKRYLAFGSGALIYRNELSDSGFEVLPDDSQFHHIKGRCLIEAAEAELPLTEVVPQYLRLPDAEINRRAGKLKV